jgi:hypothetical protein
LRPLSTNFEEQRHIGKPGLSITRSTKEWNPIVAQGPKSTSVSSFRGHSKSLSHLSAADQSFVTQSAVSTQIYSDSPLITEDHGEEATDPADRLETTVDDTPEETEENVYPEPLPLAILIIGLCLSVFLISLDRTIITTVCSLFPPEVSMLMMKGHPIYHQ